MEPVIKLCHLHSRTSKRGVAVLALHAAVYVHGEHAGSSCAAGVHVVLCTLVRETSRVLAHECRGKASHPVAVCQPGACALCSWWEVCMAQWHVTLTRSAGHVSVCTPVLCRGFCPWARCHGGGEGACINLCPTALLSTGPSTCWLAAGLSLF